MRRRIRDAAGRRAVSVARGWRRRDSGCGKKGPPLPPLVQAARRARRLRGRAPRAGIVDIQFTVPARTPTASRPANVARVDVYALTGAVDAHRRRADQARHAGRQRRGQGAARSRRRRSSRTMPDADIEPPEGPGLDQGAVDARVRDASSADGVRRRAAEPRAPTHLRRRRRQHARPPRAAVDRASRCRSCRAAAPPRPRSVRRDRGDR